MKLKRKIKEKEKNTTRSSGRYKFVLSTLFFILIASLAFSIKSNLSQASSITEDDKVVIDTESNKTTSFGTFEVVLGGGYKRYQDLQFANPLIKYQINSDTIKLMIGNEKSFLLSKGDSTAYFLTNALDFLFRTIGNENTNSYFFYNPDIPLGSSITIEKKGDTIEKRKIGKHRFLNTDAVKYSDLDSFAIEVSSVLVAELTIFAKSEYTDTIETNGLIEVTSIEEALKHPEKVYKLNLRNKKIRSIPSDVEKLTNLQILNISGSYVESLPDEIGSCSKLKSIIGHSSQLSELPTSIGKLKNLRYLGVSNCKLKSIPSEIGDIEGLWDLSISNNQIEEIPENLIKLQNLTAFSMENNRIEKFPKAILGMEHLWRLSIFGNKIKMVPNNLSKLRYLNHIRLDKKMVSNTDTLSEKMPSVIFLNGNE